MSDSSDEDLNSENEFIDLTPLWRQSFISDVEEDPVTPEFYDCDGSPSRIIELTPSSELTSTSLSADEVDTAHNFMNEILNMSYRMANARMARQRLIDLGRTGLREENSASSSRQHAMWPNSQTTIYPPSQTEDSFDQSVQNEWIHYRFNQLRHRVPGTSLPRWAYSRRAAPTTVYDPDRMVETIQLTKIVEEDDLDMTSLKQSNFILPSALEEWELKKKMDDRTRAKRDQFVTDLMFSLITKQAEPHSFYISQDKMFAKKRN